MYSYFKGKLEEKYNEYIVLETSNIGYDIYMPLDDIEKISKDDDIKVYTYLEHKEDHMKLYGFLDNNKLQFFKKLITVSGIGAKVAIAIISNISAEEMCNAIITENVLTLKAIPGIGPKMAAKIIFELKDKVSKEEIIVKNKKENKDIKEAKVALKVLGYNDKIINECFKDECLEELSTQDIIKLCLKKLQR